MYFRYKALLLKKRRIILKIDKQKKSKEKTLTPVSGWGGGDRGWGLYIHVN